MTTSIESAATATPGTVIADTVKAFRTGESPRPPGPAVTAALLTLEKATKKSGQSIALANLYGTWRLCFSASRKARYQSGQPTGSGFYIPKLAIAQIRFHSNDAEPQQFNVTNELILGPLKIRFTGPARYPGKKNLLVFDFTHLEIRCLGLKVYGGTVGQRNYQVQSFAETAIAKLPFFAFFAATPDYIAARGRGGGLAIWVRQEDQKQKSRDGEPLLVQ